MSASSGVNRTVSTHRSKIALQVAVACVGLAGAVPGFSQSGDCFSKECFFSGQIRDFQIVDSDTMVIYAGRDRCAFVVEVNGMFCDLTYLPQVEFFRTRDRILESNTGRRGDDGGFGRNDRICPNTAMGYSLETFGFTSLDVEDMPRGRPACELRGATPASDNDLIELLTIEGIAAPPPPIGNGDITRSEPAPAAE